MIFFLLYWTRYNFTNAMPGISIFETNMNSAQFFESGNLTKSNRGKSTVKICKLHLP